MTTTIKSDQATITSLKRHREGQGDSAIAPLDMKIKCTALAGAAILSRLLGREEANAFWFGEDKDISFPNFPGSGINAKVENVGLQIPSESIDLKNLNLGAFSFKVLPGGAVELSFNAVVKNLYPASAEYEKINHLFATQADFGLEITDGKVESTAKEPKGTVDDNQEDLDLDN